MAAINNLKNFNLGGLDQDDSPEKVAANDFISAYNVRSSGTSAGEDGYITNIESNIQLANTAPQGLNKIIGFKGFENINSAIAFRYNSQGLNQILKIDYETNAVTTLYTDQTNSVDGAILLPLNPNNYLQLKLVNDTYLVWADGLNEVGYINLTTLESGGYGSLLLEDLTLIKPQNLIPIQGAYISDAGRAANFIKPNLFQFTSQYINTDFNYSTWGTWSKRIIPAQESTPTIGTDVTQNNCIVITVDIGSIRANQINIAARYAGNDFSIIKQVTRAYATALPNTAVDVTTEVYEAYNPTTNTYSFAFYNTDIAIPVPATDTDQFADYIYPANSVEVLNGNLIAIADLQVGYERPTTSIQADAIGYDPNVTITLAPTANRLNISYINSGSSGSGEGDHKRYVQVNFLGAPVANDKITVVLQDIRNSNSTLSYTYTVLTGDTLLHAIANLSAEIPNSSYRQDTASPQVILSIVTPSYFGLQNAYITLFNAGATVSKSVHGVLDNSSYQLALSYRDKYGRPFPLQTGNEFIVHTQSFAQLNGSANQISWNILQSAAPVGAFDYQWLITKNSTVTQGSLLDVFGNVLNFLGEWSASTNSPTLHPQSGTVGDTYQIGAPNGNVTTFNLGKGDTVYNSGDYVVYNGISWDILPKSFGDLTSAGTFIAIKINPLYLFNQNYANEGIDTVLNYDYSVGDRCTLHYYLTGSNPSYINTPCIDVSVLGFDPATYLLKIEKSSALTYSGSNLDYNGVAINGKDIFLRLYSPNTQQITGDTSTQSETAFFEIGERFLITGGVHDTLQGFITDGDIYVKSRSYNGAVDPSSEYSITATDFNFSDFYPSQYTSYGRPRSYFDTLEKTEQKATIAVSQTYISGSRLNGLNRFFAADLYGDGSGQTSSSKGAIQVMWQRGSVLCVGQDYDWFYIPVNYAWQVLNEQLTGLAISEKLLNNGRYEAKGIGVVRDSFVNYEDLGYFVSAQRSEPMQLRINGVLPISGKMTKFFRSTIQSAISSGFKVTGYYDTFNNEYVLTIQLPGNSLVSLPFNSFNWNVFDPYIIAPSDVTAIPNTTNSTVAYNSSTGIAVYTPTTGFIGNDVGTVTFNANGGSVTKNICLNWSAGTTTVNNFNFIPLTNQPESTLLTSNSILVFGNNVAVPISISSGGQYSVNGGAFTGSAGMVNQNDTVVVRQTSSATGPTETDVTLTISTTTGVFRVTTGSTAVNPFTFTPLTGQAISTVFTSNAITVSGNTLPVPISISGGTYNINGGSYTSSAGTVNAGDIVTVKVTSSASYNTAVVATLNIGGTTGTFSVTTEYVNAFSFVPANNAALSTTIISAPITVSGANVGTYPISITGGSYSINGGSYTTAPGNTSVGDSITVECLSSSSNSTITSCTLTIQDKSATFNVTTLGASGATGILVIDIFDTTTINAYAYVNTPGATIPYQQPVYTGNNFYPTGSTDAANAWGLSSDLNPPQPTRRFEFNIQKLIATYPAEPTFTIIVAGRDTSSGTMRGSYVNRSAADSQMVMGGSPGSYLPTVSGTILASTNYSGYAVVAGANGTYGIGIGAEIIKFVYDVATMVITVST